MNIQQDWHDASAKLLQAETLLQKQPIDTTKVFEV
jgi:hypothetical protein